MLPPAPSRDVELGEEGVSTRMGAPARWILAALVLAGLTLRLWSIGFGLPGVYNVDETPILNRALAFAKGDPNPHNFLYPTLHFYLLFAWQGLYFAFGWLAGWFESAAAFEQRYFVRAARQRIEFENRIFRFVPRFRFQKLLGLKNSACRGK